MDTFSYSSAFGLSIRSDRPIPGLQRTCPCPDVDVDIRVGAAPALLREVPPPLDQAHYVSPFPDAKGCPSLVVWKVGDGCYFRLLYADGTEFLVSHSGAKVWATWLEPMTLDDTATYLLGPILGVVLRLHSAVCLHASAVALGGWAVALVGSAGAGKSTTAAAFARRGFPVLSDDVSALGVQDETLLVHPGNPRLRLWPQSAQALFGAPDALPRLTPNWDKLFLDLGGNDFAFQEAPLSLGAVYVLGERSSDMRAPYMEPLSPQESFLELVRNAYVAPWLNRAMMVMDFELFGRLVRCAPVRRVVPHEDPARLPALCQAILDDFQGILRRVKSSHAHEEFLRTEIPTKIPAID